jgi:hypothetical protein
MQRAAANRTANRDQASRSATRKTQGVYGPHGRLLPLLT